jgi:hypothetical protein
VVQTRSKRRAHKHRQTLGKPEQLTIEAMELGACHAKMTRVIIAIMLPSWHRENWGPGREEASTSVLAELLRRRQLVCILSLHQGGHVC